MDIKYFWTKTHTLLGITAGTVLCVVGVTGAIQSFEEDLLKWMNPEVFNTAQITGSALPIDVLLKHAQTAMPDKRISSWQVYSDPGHPVRVGFAGRPQASVQQGAEKPPKPRAEYRYLNSSTSELHAPLRGEDFFHTVNDIHRRLAAGDAGKQIVGASVLGLVVLSLSGLYLRWPHNPQNWRNWFRLDFRLKGRRFLRDLHMMTGTWLLLLYLLSALTGLYWSYDWYKNGLYALSGSAPPVREMKLTEPASSTLDIEKAWWIFQQETGGLFHDATLRIPEKAEHALEIRYLDEEPAHNRAYNRLFINPDSGAVIAHERYAGKSTGEKLIASIFPLHTGDFFGLPGILLLMISSLLMPLFGITGWKMYLDRHRREHGAAMAAEKRASQGAGIRR
jgi:sulfite reductase (NADPH) flavoprotein alpha-component